MAREVGVEGKLGGQASVPGAAGTWKDLTDNVNQLAANLTTQVRAIAEVATAVTKGDLTRSIAVEAQGEVAALKDNINEMIRNLRDTTQKNTRAGLAEDQPRQVQPHAAGPEGPAHGRPADPLRARARGRPPSTAVFYILDGAGDRARAAAARQLRPPANARRSATASSSAKGLVGQCALEKEKIVLTGVPQDYIRDHLRARRGGAASTSSCCPCCSKAR